MSSDEIEQKIVEYATFVEQVLGPDLLQAEASRNKIQKDIDEYKELQKRLQSIDTIKPSKLDVPGEEGEGVDLGYNTIYCHAVIPNLNTIFVHVGMGFHSELTISEALIFIPKRIQFLQQQVLVEREQKVKDITTHLISSTTILGELRRELGQGGQERVIVDE